MDVLWADAEIESVSFDYDVARLTLRESTGHGVVVCADGLLGVELVGLWDEAIIESGAFVPDDEFGRRCLDAVERRMVGGVRDSGSPARNSGSFQTLVVTLIDGAELRITAASFTTRRAEPT
jgi:hypothetical protein